MPTFSKKRCYLKFDFHTTNKSINAIINKLNNIGLFVILVVN